MRLDDPRLSAILHAAAVVGVAGGVDRRSELEGRT
jgi:hypothetical protein